jgi:hypothetical protein
MQQECSPEAANKEMQHMIVIDNTIERLSVQQPSARTCKKHNCCKVKSAR